MILEVKNLNVFYGGQSVLENISFSVEKGDTLAIIGPNGAGKTMLFRVLLGAIPFRGEIIKEDGGSCIGYVPQKIDLERDLPLTVAEFLLLGERALDAGYAPQELVKLVGLENNFLQKRIGELSAGEFQRVLIAWAVKDKPSLLLFDEPTASVDIAGQETVYELLHRLQDMHGLTLILISHDLTVVYKYANKVLCLNNTQVCFGSPSDVLTPEELGRLYGGSRKLYHHNHTDNHD